MIPQFSQVSNIALHDEVDPHLGVHSRSKDDRRPRGHDDCRQQVVGYAPGHLADGVGRGRSHQHDVRQTGQVDVGHRLTVVPPEHVHRHRIAAGRFQRQWGDEAGHASGPPPGHTWPWTPGWWSPAPGRSGRCPRPPPRCDGSNPPAVPAGAGCGPWAPCRR